MKVFARALAATASAAAPLLVEPGHARACAVCGAAERALPANAAEVPFEGRVRATVEARAATFATTVGPQVHVQEVRLEAGAAVAVTGATMLALDLPVLGRTVRSEAPVPLTVRGGGVVPEANRMMLGDVALRASHVAWRTVDGRRLTVGAGVKLPTAPLERDATGTELMPDLQPGCGSIVPMLAATYASMGTLVSAWTTASFLMPVSVRDGAHPGDSARLSATLQLQPTTSLASRIGVHGRYDTTGEAGGEVVRRSGGGAGHVSTEIVVSPVTDLVLSAGAAFPIVQAMRGYRSISPVALASVGLDF